MLAAGAAVLAVFALLNPVPAARPLPGVLDGWSPLPPVEQDTGFQMLVALELPDDELEQVAECSWASCLAELSEEESLAVARALREELEGRVL